MEIAELQAKVYAFGEAAKGKRNFKEKDIIKGVSEAEGAPADECEKGLCVGVIDVVSSCIPTAAAQVQWRFQAEEYLREKDF